jgi:RNA polymerase sigma-70 factor (ECF subfamily)
MTIARSRAIDHLRKRVPEPRDTSDPSSPAAQAESPAAARELDDLLDRWRVAGLLRQIPKEEADLLRMRFYEELSQSEIAERTQIPLGTVKMRMVKALGRLRELIEDEDR